MEYITLWILVFVSMGSYNIERTFNNPIEAFHTEWECIKKVEGMEKAYASMELAGGTAWIRYSCEDVKFLTVGG